MGRKRKRNEGGENGQADTLAVPDSIRNILPMGAEPMLFADFMERFFPSLKLAELNQGSLFQCKLEKLWIATVPRDGQKPFEEIGSLTTVLASRSESVMDLVDNVIWSLVMQYRRQPAAPKNILAQGYVLNSDMHETMKIRPCPNMRPGVVCQQLNDLVLFWKSSDFGQQLHRLVGDVVLRVLLLRTWIFLPILDDDHENYVLLCGPKVSASSRKQLATLPTSRQPRRKRRKKRTAFNKRSNPNNSEDDKPPTWDQQASLPRNKLLFHDAYIPNVGLPSTNILNRCSHKHPSLLLHHIFDNQSKRKWKAGSNQRMQGLHLCAEILKQHNKRCDYSRLLDHYCPLRTVPKRSSLEDVAQSWTPTERVVSWVKSIVTRVFPVEFFGSTHNQTQILTKIDLFLTMRVTEQFQNKLLVERIRITDMRWLWNGKSTKKRKRQDLFQATQLARQVLNWFFVSFVIPLVRTNFYLTPSEMSGKRILYYRNPMWSIFRALSIKKLSSQYKELQRSEAKRQLLKQRMGFSRLRLWPKATGVRPIAMLSTRTWTAVDNKVEDSLRRRKSKWESTNYILRNSFEIIRDTCMKQHSENYANEDVFGSGVFGLNELYPRLVSFLGDLRAAADDHALPPLYFVSVDIRQCYDNIDQDFLLESLSSVLNKPQYLVQKHMVWHPTPSSSAATLVPKVLSQVGRPEEYASLMDRLPAVSKQHTRSIVTHGPECCVTRREDLMALLDEHATKHLVVTTGRYGERYLLQKRGIPQGSILSSLFCNLYYGRVERRIMDISPTKPFLMIRIVDDFLVITPESNVAVEFLRTMEQGDADVGVRIHQNKTKKNFTVGESGKVTIINTTMKGFPWCGMLFNTGTCEVKVDYSRFAQVLDSMTADRSCNEGRRFQLMLQYFVKPRCQPVLYDPRINSSRTILENFCQMMLLCGMKTAAYVETALEGDPSTNIDFFVDCLEGVIVYARQLISCRFKATQPKQRLQDILSSRVARYLGLEAFGHVLGNELRRRIRRRVNSVAKRRLDLILLKAKRRFEDLMGTA